MTTTVYLKMYSVTAEIVGTFYDLTDSCNWS